MVEWHHGLNAYEFELTPGDGEGQGSLAYCSPWSHKESDMTERLDNDMAICPCPVNVKYAATLPDPRFQPPPV